MVTAARDTTTSMHQGTQAERTRQAVAEQASSASQAQSIALGMSQSIRNVFTGLFTDPPSPTISEIVQIDRRDAWAREKQRKEREREQDP